jgi:hypothetical protein
MTTKKVTDDEIRQKMHALGEAALAELRRRGLSEDEIKKSLRSKKRKWANPDA